MHTTNADTFEDDDFNLSAHCGDLWNFLDLDNISAQTHDDLPVKKVKLEYPPVEIHGESQHKDDGKSTFENSLFQDLDDLLAPFTPSKNESYLEAMSELEDALNCPNSGETYIKYEPLTPQPKSPIKSEPVESNRLEVAPLFPRDLLAFAVDEIGLNEIQVDTIPVVQSPCDRDSMAPTPLLALNTTSPPSVNPTMQPGSSLSQVHPTTMTRSKPMIRSNIPQHSKSISTVAPMAPQALSRKRNRDAAKSFPHQQILPHLPWLMQHSAQQPFPIHVPQHPARIFPCPMCCRGFHALEPLSAHISSAECVRVQFSVRLLPGGHGWQCMLCKQQLQRMDIKMHLRAHNRGEFPGKMSDIKVVIQSQNRV